MNNCIVSDKIVKLDEFKFLKSKLFSRDRIVFTNGCFDLLHAGHVSYLQQASNLGDILVVGLNSDESVHRLKGPKRPINKEKERAFVLAALSCVDYVLIFAQDTPLKLIQQIKPDFLVKGGDWDLHKIVGSKEVESSGGQVVSIPLTPGLSTSIIIKKILNLHLI